MRANPYEDGLKLYANCYTQQHSNKTNNLAYVGKYVDGVSMKYQNLHSF